ncbi:hypothetical protein B0H19DRAFT_424917 [Mycena capillaripes]|nr:hypothetical protein B0H19DRAFT_424917 [Mycena capillaripes]
MIFLNICRSWTRVALSTRALWTSIRIEFPRATKFDQLVAAWLRRADLRDTSISLRGSLYPTVGAVVQQYSQRVRNMEIHFPIAKMLPRITAPFPSLRTLTFAQDNTIPIPPEFFSQNPMKCIQMMLAAPNLVQCSFDGIWFKEQHANNPLMPATHPSLQRLRLGEHESSAAPLQYLTLPALRALQILDFDIPEKDFLSFLRRSAPPLETLAMPNISWTAEAIDTFSRLFPSLRDLQLTCSHEEQDFYFLDALGTAHNFLPNLRSLEIRRWTRPCTLRETDQGAHHSPQLLPVQDTILPTALDSAFYRPRYYCSL